MDQKTPWNPSRSATARVKNAIPAPTACPHCGGKVEIVGNEEIYGRPYGEWPWAYRCEDRKCDAYVGMHPFTSIPLGTLANKPLREARKRVKNQFNPLWQDGSLTRTQCYEALAAAMGITAGECHFGWFDLTQCSQAEQALKKGLKPAPAPELSLAKGVELLKQKFASR